MVLAGACIRGVSGKGGSDENSSSSKTRSMGRRSAVAAMIIGFAWGGWVTGGMSERNAGVAAQTAVEQAFVPLCVAKAEQQPDQLPLLKKESSYSRKDFVVKAGWVSNVAPSQCSLKMKSVRFSIHRLDENLTREPGG
jgi:hypothetical protein